MKHHEIYYATGNSGKFEEASHFIASNAPSIELKAHVVDIDEIQSLDVRIITLDKVHKAWSLIKKAVLIDDAGIYLEGYNNFPGTLSKYVYEGIGFEGIFKLCSDNQRGYFLLNLAYCDGETTECFEGKIFGSIVRPLSFNAHKTLPFTAIFKPDGSTKTLADLRGSKEYSSYNPRHQALEKFLEWFTKKYS